jgi:hypothetical protein
LDEATQLSIFSKLHGPSIVSKNGDDDFSNRLVIVTNQDANQLFIEWYHADAA